MKMSDCKYKLRKLSVGLVSVGTMFTATTVMGNEVSQPTTTEVTTSPVAVESSSTSTTPSESMMTETQAPTTATKAKTGGGGGHNLSLLKLKVNKSKTKKSPKQQPVAKKKVQPLKQLHEVSGRHKKKELLKPSK